MKTHYLLFLVIAIGFSSTITLVNAQATQQRISHLGYTYAERDTTDYHSFEIIWYSGEMEANSISPHADCKYYVIRKDTPIIEDFDIDLNQRYAEYLMEINGIHLTKHYVAWDITSASCVDNGKRVLFKAKFFNRSWDALKFYESLTGDKIRFSPSGVVDYSSTGVYDKFYKSVWTACP